MHHCGRFRQTPTSRRDLLKQLAAGFGTVAATSLMTDRSYGSIVKHGSGSTMGPLAPRQPHFKPRAKNIIFCYMDGGPSQVDTFDPKPRLQAESGKPFGMKMEPTQFNNNGNTLGSPWKFHQYGQSGITVSDLFPHVARHADNLCVIRSMTSEFPEHTNANYFLHTGLGLQGRPSMGAWVTYGLGSENQNLPGYVVLNGGLTPPGGLDCFGSGFLPATYQGSTFRPDKQAVANVLRTEKTEELQMRKLALLGKLDDQAVRDIGRVDAVESAIANYELAYQMQSSVPELTDISGESESTKEMYGLDHKFKPTQIYAMQCLLARRLIERGVRFIELTCPSVPGNDRWDQHGGLKKGHEENALAVDQPIGALLTDLKLRGLLDETLVIWAGEFGRTPFAQGSNGRDHNPFGFSIWMAGGGVKGGMVYGATDDYGYKVVKDRLEMYDMHATMLHLMGINHEQLTYLWSGREMRLTDVHGHVVYDILA